MKRIARENLPQMLFSKFEKKNLIRILSAHLGKYGSIKFQDKFEIDSFAGQVKRVCPTVVQYIRVRSVQ